MDNLKIPLTTFDFTLPKGLLDTEGTLHRHGRIRLATGKDEIFVSKDPRLRHNAAYGILLLLSRVIMRLGDLSSTTPELLEQLFLVDFLYLQALFNQINQTGVEISASGEF